jgi:hypothetical protein
MRLTTHMAVAVSLSGLSPCGSWPNSTSFREINEWVRQRFFPDDDSLFEEDFSRYPESDPKEAPSFGDAVSVAGVLWRNQVKTLQAIQSELARLRAQINARESA